MQWHALAESASTPNPFFEPWYLLASLEAFDPTGTGRLLSVEVAGELAGLMPLSSPRRYGRWPLPHLATWLHPNAFLGAPLVRAGCERVFWRALLQWADAQAGREQALFLHLPAMPLEQPLTEALFDCADEQGRKASLVMREQRALLHSPLTPELYLERALTAKKRKELRRQHSRLAEQGQLEVVRYRDATALDAWIEAFLALEKRGWKGTSNSAMACAPETEALFRNALEGAAALGRLERLSLTIDRRPIAMLANFLTPPGSFSYKTAFDEDFARYSPGVLLQRENLALLSRPEITWCDSCAAPDHPMIDSLWTERRAIGRISVAIGGKLRRSLFETLLALELGRNPVGLTR
ncbi:GNAT family N-acetyltransferase [Novosphingobium sp. 1Y9A]|uniref:GNAT family N-acetyltransferase n=2 Tax=Novosphingobium jiangmenense TaxID=2791981 RepID=A0ABS0HEK2_9SPHN|nr:GNAT family N-acetyltransferase [Novosphingobium jiangmenense]